MVPLYLSMIGMTMQKLYPALVRNEDAGRFCLLSYSLVPGASCSVSGILFPTINDNATRYKE